LGMVNQAMGYRKRRESKALGASLQVEVWPRSVSFFPWRSGLDIMADS
jgi:hypothetical protein